MKGFIVLLKMAMLTSLSQPIKSAALFCCCPKRLGLSSQGNRDLKNQDKKKIWFILFALNWPFVGWLQRPQNKTKFKNKKIIAEL